jgi:RHH-type proline utilization regulon transcriptional repressor/proline dehydrogenase/delta 1-pyrroline-5-carboxylate dehydrogenase
MDAENSLQSEIVAKGKEIFARMEGQAPSVFSPQNITGRLMEWSMRNEALKVQLFRFVDVLPVLSSSKEIARHAQEYLGSGVSGLPLPVQWGVQASPTLPWLTGFAARKGVEQMAKAFILAPNGAEAVPKLLEMRKLPLAFTVDILGETAVSETEAEQYLARYQELVTSLSTEASGWPAVDQIDRDDRGAIPRVNVSVKISALYSQIHPTDPEGALAHLLPRLLPLLIHARDAGVFINFDMEHTALKDLTFELFRRLLAHPELRGYPHAGIAFQAYLVTSERDLIDLIDWAKARSAPITIRLIKGAYWDYETVMAGQRGWPVPVFQQKSETDANYERLALRMLQSQPQIRCAFGTHSVRSIAACAVQAERLGLPPSAYEFQMLYGMAEPIKHALVAMGYRVRDYCPIGEVLPGMSYLVRRLLENTSNEGFLRATFTEHQSIEDLLRDPGEIHEPMHPPKAGVTETNLSHSNSNGASASPSHLTGEKESAPLVSTRVSSPALPPFRNEPHTDFTSAANRARMRSALQRAQTELGGKYPLVIGGKESFTEREIFSVNPARPSEVVGYVAKGGRAEADAAVGAAREAFQGWRRTAVEDRARLLERTAELMRQERFGLAACEILETGKNWTESDADVAEAIDFCDYYALEMRRVASDRYVVPGETSISHYVPRGIALVIAPWNFPLAILCGMTTAALVTGNCVIIKPAEQSSVIGAKFMDLLRRAGLPPGVANFLPGPGEEVGAYLVNHPRIDLIAFTGSREVGLGIYEAAGRTQPGQTQLKKVICEMGGKNAMIIDSDADLDEAIPAALYSAFGYSGQKCSALSRLIVLEENYDRVLGRLVEASRSLSVGLPEEPGTIIGPVIDASAQKRILEYIELGKCEATVAFQGQVPSGEGYFVPPTIFAAVPPRARIAQEEIFGPVLCVLKARDLDEALAIANDSRYALTGGLFSRSPANIERVRTEMEVGNLYINRGITGAFVARHPFGGYKMSGGGTKAGGRDYLLNFMFPRVITENRMRRGFAPGEEGDSLEGGE